MSKRETLAVWQYSNAVFVKQGKAIPVQALRGLQGSKRLRFTDFKTVSMW
jgi:hypothetical protein